MDKSELEKRMSQALQQYGADYGFVVTGMNIGKLISRGVFKSLPSHGCSGQHLCEALMAIGKVLERSEDGSSYVAAVNAGVAKMNTAFLVLVLCDLHVEVLAVATEGLIKQGTAKKAISRLERNLKDVSA